MRSFQSKWYEQIDWLCGSVTEEKLYCWPCLLFQPKLNQSWTDKGYNNFRNILVDSKCHSKSFNHFNNYKCLKSFGKRDITTAISNAAKIERQQHNSLVEENRKYLEQLTKAVLYLGKQELPLRGHDEGQDSLNKGNYRELLNIFAEIDSVFASRLATKEGSRQFSGVSSTIQNDLISAINNTIGNVIRNEVENASFISVQADETTDCAMHAQLSIVIRYVSGFKITERFLGFYEVSNDKSASNLVRVIENALNTFGDMKNKLVCQTYDGAAVMSGELNGVQTKLRERGFKYGYFIHCYAHKLNLVLSKSAEKITGVKVFFSDLHAFSKFTSSSTKRKSILRDFDISIPSLCETRWCYRTRTVSTLKSKLQNLKDAFQNIIDNAEKWDNETIHATKALFGILHEHNFMFLLNCFNEILTQAGILFDVLQCKQLDMMFAHEKINDFITFVSNCRTDESYQNLFQQTILEIEQPEGCDSPPQKKKQRETNGLQRFIF